MLGRLLALLLLTPIYGTIDIPLASGVSMMVPYGLLFMALFPPYSHSIALATILAAIIALIPLSPLCNELTITSRSNIAARVHK